MSILEQYSPTLHLLLKSLVGDMAPWDIADKLPDLLDEMASGLGREYERRGGVLVHKSANVHPTAILQDLVIVMAGATVGPHAILRSGVLVGHGAHVGGSDEIKQSIIGPDSAAAHLNYIGNSIVGAGVNIEAGAVLANHFNERENKTINVILEGTLIVTGVTKFGAMVGDGARIGANSVTTPGTMLASGQVVSRLELVEQSASR